MPCPLIDRPPAGGDVGFLDELRPRVQDLLEHLPALTPEVLAAFARRLETTALAAGGLVCFGAIAGVWFNVTRSCWLAVDANPITIAAAGAVPPLITLLASPAVDVQDAAAGALRNLAMNGACMRVRLLRG